MEDKNIFIRAERLLGAEKLTRIKKARVAVFGVGGVGSYVAEALARSGVGSVTLIDHDTVSPSNINRQLHALHSTLGRFKAEIMAERLRDINPEINAEALIMRYPPETRAWEYDYIADAVDTTETKLRLALEAKGRGIPIIASMGAGNRLDPTAFRAADIYETRGCPLAKVMRKLYRENGIESLKVIYSAEPPVKGLDVIGSVAFVPAAAGLLMAAEIVKEL